MYHGMARPPEYLRSVYLMLYVTWPIQQSQLWQCNSIDLLIVFIIPYAITEEAHWMIGIVCIESANIHWSGLLHIYITMCSVRFNFTDE